MKRIITAVVIAAILILSLVSVSAEGDTVAGLDLSYTVKDNGNILINASIVDITDPTGISGLIYYVKFNTRLMEYVASDVPVPSSWESLVAYDAVDALFYNDGNDFCWLEFVSYSGYTIKADNQLRLQIELEPIVTNVDLQIEFACDSLYNDSPSLEPLKGTSKTLTIKKSDLKPVVGTSSEIEESSEAVSSEIDITSDIPVSEPSSEPSIDEPSVESSSQEIPAESSAEEFPNISIGELIPSEDESSAEEILPSEDESSAEEMIPSEDESSVEESISSEETVSSEDEPNEDISAEISSEIENESSSVEGSIAESDPSDVESAESDSNTLENASSEDILNSANNSKSNDDDDDDDDDRVKSKKDNNTLIWVIVSVAAVVIIGAAVTVVILLRKKKVK